MSVITYTVNNIPVTVDKKLLQNIQVITLCGQGRSQNFLGGGRLNFQNSLLNFYGEVIFTWPDFGRVYQYTPAPGRYGPVCGD